jgi:hypothetical protein
VGDGNVRHCDSDEVAGKHTSHLLFALTSRKKHLEIKTTAL